MKFSQLGASISALISTALGHIGPHDPTGEASAAISSVGSAALAAAQEAEHAATTAASPMLAQALSVGEADIETYIAGLLAKAVGPALGQVMARTFVQAGAAALGGMLQPAPAPAQQDGVALAAG